MMPASLMVESLCATMRVVRERWARILSIACLTRRSLSVSRALVASSSNKILGSRIMALAIATRCFWPPLSVAPRSPTAVSYPSWNALTKS
mmetsp:Transcript_70101/g.194929  ORF Transcript_70101/g.194929 Transcript_70101/m.194929 type:complete len:91 (+) Transcript_70101:2241-2513(+)